MYDFCFTPIYATLLAVGGVIGFIAKGSTASLAGGVGSALILSLLTYISFQYYKDRQSCKLAVLASLGISACLSVFMYQRFSQGFKVHNAIGAAISGLMSMYYVWNLVLFKPKFGTSHKAA
ncbi:hypothetical protein CEUSTIGMA_g2164.t1 [Chlamydomonas eustigma]|uniref:Uncharacterized protein n=1 Tax=Chlamydomonas eustigma TaxID=1157962 RepID=A0A250WVD0_9CHLO|nr:hypothetical protein CEUSTIGMA_g2164.t1 [Chlamydomonas eustigma]|eukprot:GAX74716.1 hypothetical protein CEUSTIGMA_g2164.t1 [Chlamydomonas eustigma]